MSFAINWRRALPSCLVLAWSACLGLSAANSSHGLSLDSGPIRTPLGFEVNRGQFRQGVHFVTRSDDFVALFRDSGIEFLTPDGRKSLGGLSFAGAAAVEPAAYEELPGRTNYYFGADPDRWILGVPFSNEVRYQNIYPGVDVLFYGNRNHLEFDLVVAEGADPHAIALELTGAVFEEETKGVLKFRVGGGSILLRSPFVYQRIDGTTRQVDARYMVEDRNRLRFDLGTFDTRQVLTIDPIFDFISKVGTGTVQDLKVDAQDRIFAVGMTDSNRYLLSHAVHDRLTGGGIFRRATNETRWEPAGLDGLEVELITPSPSDPQTVYATVASPPDLYRSENGGDTWIKMTTPNAGAAIDLMAVHPTRPAEIFALDFNDLFRSTDGGATWSLIAEAPFLLAERLFIDPTNPDRLFALDSDEIYRTDDGGRNWEQLVNGLPEVFFNEHFEISLADPHVLIAYSSSAAWITRDSGSSWTELSLPAEDTRFFEMALDSADPEIMYLADGVFMYRTDDGGGTWEYMSEAEHVVGIQVDPNDPSVLYGRDRQSNDQGASWFELARGLTNPGVHAVPEGFPVVAASEPAVLYTTQSIPTDVIVTGLDVNGSDVLFSTYLGGVGFDEGLAVNLDPGGDVLLVGRTESPDFPLVGPIQAELRGTNDAFVTRINASGQIVYSTYLGGNETDRAFEVGPAPDGGAIIVGETGSVDFPAQYAPAPPSGGGIYRSTDNGSSWQLAVAGLPCSSNASLSYAQGILFAALPCGLYRSSDEGRSWQALPTQVDADVNNLAVDPDDSDLMVAATDQGIYRSENGGADWALITAGIPARQIFEVDFSASDFSVLYAAAGTERREAILYQPGFPILYRSNNSGLSWQRIDVDTEGGAQILAVHPQKPNFVLVGHPGTGILLSENGGGSWTLATGLAVNDIAFDPVNPSHVFASNVAFGGSSHAVIRSDNEGRYWSIDNTGIETGFALDARAVAVSRGEQVFLGHTFLGLFQKGVTQGTWHSSGEGVGSQYITHLLAHPTSPNTVWASTESRSDCFVARIAADGSSLARAALVGGNAAECKSSTNSDKGSAAHIGADGTVYLATGSRSRNLPYKNAIAQTVSGSQGGDLMLAGIAPGLDSLDFLTHIGASSIGNPDSLALTQDSDRVLYSLVVASHFPGLNLNEGPTLILASYNPSQQRLTPIRHIPTDRVRDSMMTAAHDNQVYVYTSGAVSRRSLIDGSVLGEIEVPGLTAFSVDAGGELFAAGAFDFGSLNSPLDESGQTGIVRIRESVEALYFPYLVSDPPTFTGYAISNYSDLPATVQFHGHDRYSFSALNADRNPSSFSLSPKEQVARTGAEIFQLTRDDAGWAEVFTDNAQVGSFFQFGGAGRLDGSVAQTERLEKFYFTRVYQGPSALRGERAETTLYIANPGTAFTTVELRLFEGGSGIQPAALVAETSEYISGSEVKIQTIRELFGVDSAGGYVEVEVTEGEPLVGFQTIELDEVGTAIGLNAVPATEQTTSYSAQLAHGEAVPGIGFFTGLKLINTSDATRNLTISAVDEAGETLGTPAGAELGPGESRELDLGEFLGLGPAQGTSLLAGSFTVDANGPGVIGDVLFGNPSDVAYAASLALVQERYTHAVFSQVANALGLFTGLAFFNPDAGTARVTVTVFDQGGNETGMHRFDLGPGQRLSQSLGELVPTTAGQIGGHIVVESTRPIVAQQLFGDLALTFLSAVPPTLLE